MNFPFQRVLNYSGLILIALILFSIGFYFGYKNSEANLTLKSQSTENAVKDVASAITNSSESVSDTKTSELKNVSGVFWIKAGKSPVCPPDYLIKGKFDSPASFYYMKDNKSYERVKADICFASEEIARDVAGFIKKF